MEVVPENGQAVAGGLGQGWVRMIGVCVVGLVVSVHGGIAKCERPGHVIVLTMLGLCLCLVVGLGCVRARWFVVALVLVLLCCSVVSCDLQAIFQVVSTQ